MNQLKKYTHKLLIRYSILHDFIKALWKYKLWWSLPIIFILLILMVLLLIAGHTGVAALIYPLF